MSTPREITEDIPRQRGQRSHSSVEREQSRRGDGDVPTAIVPPTPKNTVVVSPSKGLGSFLGRDCPTQRSLDTHTGMHPAGEGFTPPQPSATESLRLAALARYDVLDTPPEETYNHITSLAAKLFHVPIAGIALIDHERIWFKAAHGFELRQMQRDTGLFSAALHSNKNLQLVRDAQRHDSLRTHPFVTGSPGVRFFCSAPLRTPDGLCIGSVFIADHLPRSPASSQLSPLVEVADLVMCQLKQRASDKKVADALAESRELKIQLNHAQKVESLGLLAGGIAHDFNNLLTSIMGYADLARDANGLDNAGRGHLDSVIAAASRASSLCQRFLTYASRGSGNQQHIDINESIRESVELLRVTLPPSARLHLSNEATTRPIMGDPDQIAQVLMNLIINASEALGGQTGDIFIKTQTIMHREGDLRDGHMTDRLEPGEVVELEVRDTGCGMSPETLDQLFDPFFTTKQSGRGLGMAAVLGIVKSHHGGLLVESELGQGTKFTLRFPTAGDIVIARDRRGSTLSERMPAAKAPRVLLVDDEESVRDVTALMLEKAGYECIAVHGGPEALELLSTDGDEIRCVILDLTMPRMDGRETMARIHRERPHLPIILSSGYAHEELAKRAPDEAAAGYISKPYVYAQLIRKLRDVMDAASSATPGPAAQTPTHPPRRP